jgi:mannitol/fructose-specific phosphotransferase system IIA component (Ntr-type)
MRLSELLSPSSIRIPLQAHDKAGVLRELVALMIAGDGAVVGTGNQPEEVMAAILERERQFPTGIGYGVAVPHGKTPALSALRVVAGTSPDPIAYETIDGEPVRLFFLLAGPESLAGAHVKAISRISRLVRRDPVRQQLIEAPTPQEFYRVLCEAEGA